MPDLLKKLEEYDKSNNYPFHMPGHKRKEIMGAKGLPYHLDITEIEGFDNLHACEEGEILYQMAEEMRKFYGAAKTFPLVNGSTCGIMSAISTCAGLNDEIIIGRNCHKSVYRTAELLGLNVHYLYPERVFPYDIYGNLTEEEVRRVLSRYPESKCVVVTSPTYEGVILDISLISRVAHEYGMMLIVDEAHGAHLPYFRKEGENTQKECASAIYRGADLVIQSLHKTLPALTQTAVLHVTSDACFRNGFSMERLAGWVSLYQSSSPSYILMASINTCFNLCKKWSRDGIFENYQRIMEHERKEYEKLVRLHLLTKEETGAYGYDWGKLVFTTVGCTVNGKELSTILRNEYCLELEMAAGEYVIAMTSVCDIIEQDGSESGLKRLRKAMFDIDRRLLEEDGIYRQKDTTSGGNIEEALAGLTIREALEGSSAELSLDKILFQLENDYVKSSTIPLSQMYQPFISGDNVKCNPPGIPLLAPGEFITKEIIEKINKAVEDGLTVLGVNDNKIKVVI